MTSLEHDYAWHVQEARARILEERVGQWLERLGWMAGGICIGAFALGAAIIF